MTKLNQQKPRPIHALKDNYIWMLVNNLNRFAWVVDPGQASPVISILRAENLQLKGILLTHHHADHSGGIPELLDYAGDLAVYGAQNSPVSQVNTHVTHENRITINETDFTCLSIPGHTLDHTAYFGDKMLFSGDTLFSAGCGRVFEGTMPQMYHSLNILFNLPDDTQIYCGHEYTRQNLKFAKAVEPENPFIQNKISQLSHHTECSLPTLLAEEKQINPFLRCHVAEVKRSAENYCGKQLNSAVEVFTVLREWKNNFT